MTSRDIDLAATLVSRKKRVASRATSATKALNGRQKKGAATGWQAVPRSNGSGSGYEAAECLSPETTAAQAGGFVDGQTGGIVPPIHVATTFVRDEDNQYRRGYCYGRSDNASVRLAERVLNQLEEGAGTFLFASGMAAAATAFLALERPAHVVAPTAMYWGLRQWLIEDAPSHGIETTLVDAGDHRALWAAVKPGRTRLVWIETPSNPLWSITDIAEAAHIAHEAGALLAVDSTVPIRSLEVLGWARKCGGLDRGYRASIGQHATGDSADFRPSRLVLQGQWLRRRHRTQSGPIRQSPHEVK